MPVGIVTGGASGIGAACVRRLAQSGHSVVVADYSLVEAERLAAELGEQVHALEVDVTSEASCQRMASFVRDRFGNLDFAVNSAGVGNADSSPLANVSFSEWRRVLSVNLDGLFLSMTAEIDLMSSEAGGAIVNISSVMGQVATPGAAAYVASKHGVVGLTKAAALDYASKGIRVNAIGPGYVETPMLAGRLSPNRPGASTSAHEEIAGRHPIGRIATPEEIAEAAAFLVDHQSSFISGAYIPVDGG